MADHGVLTFASLEGIPHGVTTRHLGDARAGGIRAALGLEPERVVRAEQTHGDTVAQVGAADGGTVRPATDALVTQDPGVYLMLLFADCVPILLHHPDAGSVGIVHAGWKGTAARIAMRAAAATDGDPRRLRAVIGPAIGGCCYEVGEEVVAAVTRAACGADVVRPGRRDRPHLDLIEANRAQLLAAGLSPEHVETSGICTSCRVDSFFSHRAEHGRAGRQAAFIGLPR